MPAVADRAAVEALDPSSVWKIFSGIAAVPRPSKQEERIRAHVVKLARSLNLVVREDRVGNVLIEAPATRGRERAAPLVLQGHLDMVCEKNAGTQHDFDREGIRLVLDHAADGRRIVRGDGTTLGADNGIGVSLALAAATDPGCAHGPLEILCTIDEEAGMTGAKNIEPGFFKGRRMINLDSEEDDAIYIGCAGGTDTTLIWNLPTGAPATGMEACRVSVSGLKGGHSGCDIHLNRGSALALLVQTLQTVAEPALQLASMTGGSKRNAIPREASANVLGPRGMIERLTRAAAAIQAEAATGTEPACQIKVEPAAAGPVISAADTRRVLDAVAALPHGVLAVVPDIAGLVQTSNGTTTVNSTLAGASLRIEVGCLSRSSSKTDMSALVAKIGAVARLAGAAAEQANDYPGWQPNRSSPTLAACQAEYERVFGHAPRIASIHAGLECGIIGERVGGMDMVSFGPNISGAHSPDERVDVASVQRIYKYLVAVLGALSV